jgi:hypothetical protein
VPNLNTNTTFDKTSLTPTPATLESNLTSVTAAKRRCMHQTPLPVNLRGEHTSTSSRPPLTDITSIVVNQPVCTNSENQNVTQPSLLSHVVQNQRNSINIGSLRVNLENQFANATTNEESRASIETASLIHKRKGTDLNSDVQVASDGDETSQSEDEDYMSQSSEDSDQDNNEALNFPDIPREGIILLSFN